MGRERPNRRYDYTPQRKVGHGVHRVGTFSDRSYRDVFQGEKLIRIDRKGER